MRAPRIEYEITLNSIPTEDIEYRLDITVDGFAEVGRKRCSAQSRVDYLSSLRPSVPLIPVVTRMKASSSLQAEMASSRKQFLCGRVRRRIGREALHIVVYFDDVVQALDVAFENCVAYHRQIAQQQFDAGHAPAPLRSASVGSTRLSAFTRVPGESHPVRRWGNS